MSIEENKQIAGEVFDSLNAAIAGQDVAAFQAFLAAARRGQPEGEAPQAGPRPLFLALVTAVPDLHFTIDEQIAEGDKVVTRATGRGTHTGALPRAVATGHPVELAIVDIARVEDGQVKGRWMQIGWLAVLQQIGLLPRAAGGAAGLAPAAPAHPAEHAAPPDSDTESAAGDAPGDTAGAEPEKDPPAAVDALTEKAEQPGEADAAGGIGEADAEQTDETGSALGPNRRRHRGGRRGQHR